MSGSDVSGSGRAPIAAPLRFDGRGRSADTTTEKHLRDLIEAVLLTAPGERVMRPTYGSGLLQIVFAPNGDQLAATLQMLVAGSLQQWLGDLIEVQDVSITPDGETLTVSVDYTVRSTGESASDVRAPGMTTPDRRAALIDARTINGVDFVEISATVSNALQVHFVFNLFDPPTVDPATPTLPPNPSGTAPLNASNFTVSGGERITGIKVLSAAQTSGDYNQLSLLLDEVGDFSTYTLTLANPSGGPPGVPAGFDPQSASADFVFHVDCAKDFDCAPEPHCPPLAVAPPRINYLAKDYPGFVQAMLDRMALLAPRWQERNTADLGVAVVETLGYVADHLSYRQDAIATEAYLGTARLRTSVRRHARLVDYHIGEGSNARAWLQVTVHTDGVILPAATTCATTYPGATPPALGHDTHAYQQALNAGAVFFETLGDSPPLYPAHGEMPLYNWSESQACLAPGTTHATLDGAFPHLAPGMVLILAEKLGPLTGDPADADPGQRQAVRLTAVATGTDPLQGRLVTEIDWHPEDSLTFPLCLASVTDAPHGEHPTTGVSAAWGNIVLADQGRSTGTASDPLSDGQPEVLGPVPDGGRFRPALAGSPLTFAAAPPDQGGAALAAATGAGDARVPAITLYGSDHPDQPWSPVADLLDASIGSVSRVFVPEIENDATAYLLFGDGINGMAPDPGTVFTAQYRVGNGTAGNVARDTVVLVDSAVAGVVGVSNPMPAWGGIDPESVDHVRQSAPVAFRTQKRAVTANDFVAVAVAYPGVQRAAATMRWTGSWTTVFLTVEHDSQGVLDPGFITGLEAELDGYRMAGVDLEVEDGVRVPLHIQMQVCLQPGYVAADVQQDLLVLFSNQVAPDGTPGLFSPDRLDLGQPFYLSPLYAAAQSVDGVASAQILAFERQNAPSVDGLRSGVLIPQRTEFFVLDNDPSFPERGLFELSVGGGL